MGHNLPESTWSTLHPLRQYGPPYCTKGQSCAQWKSIEGNQLGEQMNSEVLIQLQETLLQLILGLSITKAE
jgi:hypothetical protein